MRRLRLTPFLLAILASFALCLPASAARSDDTLTAHAPPIGPFDRLVVSGHAELVLVQGDREAVTIEAPARSRPRIRVRSSHGRLTIETIETTAWWNWFGASGRAPTITVHFKVLDVLETNGAVKVTAASIQGQKLSVQASGASSVKVDALQVDTLRFSGSGAVKAEFAGRATDQDISISGAGTLRAGKLASDTASVAVSGAGKVVVNAQKRLEASISGAGVIEYFGDPALEQRIRGAGKIVRRSGETVAPVRLRAA